MQLVSHWRLWWRRWSTWLAGLYAAVTAIMFANPTVFIGLVGFFPVDWRGFLAGVLFFALFAIPVLITHIRQTKLVEKANASPK